MSWFLIKIVAAMVFIVGAKYCKKITENKNKNYEGDGMDPFLLKTVANTLRLVAVLCMLWAIVGTSVIWVTSGHIATVKRVYFGSSLPPGRIVALDGQAGPQARIFTAGFHLQPFITLINEIDQVPIFTVPDGKCALLSAKDGQAVTGGQAFAAPWTDAVKQAMVNDAVYFLTEGKGQRGPQTTVLTPGSYTINPFLWEAPRIIPATRVEQGTVGVVKSSVLASVDFGSFRRPMPTNNTLTILSAAKLPAGSASALLVPVGAVGVWEEALPNGLFYVNTEAYKITMVPVVAQVYEYKGGYKRRIVDISVDDKGQIAERVSESEVQEVKNSADRAIFTKPEGWDVAQEMRVLAQIIPELAPFVVASLGLTEQNASQVIEDRIVTPIIRSVTRDVEGGEQIAFTHQQAELGPDGKPVLNEKGEPKIVTVHEFRSIKVLDLLENRTSIEAAIEQQSGVEALKEGITILEVRLSETSIPAELLIARKREQLAQQLQKAWAQEEIAQRQRQKTENARSQAEQQSTLVKADIAQQAAEKNKEARLTEGEGEKGYMIALAEGQRAQKDVLGSEETTKLQMFQQVLKFLETVAEKNPEVLVAGLQNASKFVPNVVVNGGSGGGSGAEGAAAIFGSLMSANQFGTPKSPDIKLGKVPVSLVRTNN